MTRTAARFNLAHAITKMAAVKFGKAVGGFNYRATFRLVLRALVGPAVELFLEEAENGFGGDELWASELAFCACGEACPAFVI